MSDIKISELIEHLQRIQEKHGDVKMRYSAQDSYSVYSSCDLSLNIRTGGSSGMPSDYYGYFINGYDEQKHCILQFSINNDHEGKKPKVTFRK